jgi:hypothetical protein
VRMVCSLLIGLVVIARVTMTPSGGGHIGLRVRPDPAEGRPASRPFG